MREHSRQIDLSRQASRLGMYKSESTYPACHLRSLFLLYLCTDTLGYHTTGRHCDVISPYVSLSQICKYVISSPLRTARSSSYQGLCVPTSKGSAESGAEGALVEDMEAFPVVGRVPMLVVPTRQVLLRADDPRWREKSRRTPLYRPTHRYQDHQLRSLNLASQ